MSKETFHIQASFPLSQRSSPYCRPEYNRYVRFVIRHYPNAKNEYYSARGVPGVKALVGELTPDQIFERLKKHTKKAGRQIERKLRQMKVNAKLESVSITRV